MKKNCLKSGQISWIDSEAEGLRQHLLKESLNQIASERTLLQGTEQLE